MLSTLRETVTTHFNEKDKTKTVEKYLQHPVRKFCWESDNIWLITLLTEKVDAGNTKIAEVSYRLFETAFFVWGTLRAKGFLGNKIRFQIDNLFYFSTKFSVLIWDFRGVFICYWGSIYRESYGIFSSYCSYNSKISISINMWTSPRKFEKSHWKSS